MLKYTELDISKIIIDELIYNDELNQYESYVLYFNNSELKKLIFQSSYLKLVNITKNLENNTKTITVEFLKNHPNFYKFIYNLDNHIFENVFDNSENIIGQKGDRNVFKNLFIKSINLQDTLFSNPTMTLNIDNDCNFYDKDKQKINFDDLKIGNEILCLIKIDRIIFEKNRFYVNYLVNNIYIENYICNTDEYLFIEESDDGLNNENNFNNFDNDIRDEIDYTNTIAF